MALPPPPPTPASDDLDQDPVARTWVDDADGVVEARPSGCDPQGRADRQRSEVSDETLGRRTPDPRTVEATPECEEPVLGLAHRVGGESSRRHASFEVVEERRLVAGLEEVVERFAVLGRSDNRHRPEGLFVADRTDVVRTQRREHQRTVDGGTDLRLARRATRRRDRDVDVDHVTGARESDELRGDPLERSTGGSLRRFGARCDAGTSVQEAERRTDLGTHTQTESGLDPPVFEFEQVETSEDDRRWFGLLVGRHAHSVAAGHSHRKSVRQCGILGRVKITDVTTFVIKNPPSSFGGRYFIVVRLTTDTGIVGYGEIYAATFGPHVISTMVDDVAARWVIDQDPNRIELMWRRIYSSGYSLRPDPTLVGIMSGLEMACWDIVGKDAGKPVYDLLGGRVHDKLRTYTYLYPSAGWQDVYTNPDHAAARAVNEVERGFTALKFDPAGPYTAFDGHMPSQDDIVTSARMISAIRSAVGPGADLLFGTHGQFTAAGAIRLARELEPFDPLWFEEPCTADLPHEMARVAAQTSIPVATGERLTTISEFAALGRHQAASIWQPNLGRCGGILAGKKIAAIAEANGCQIAPHLYSGPILGAANVQLAATLPNLLIIEGIREWNGFHADLLTTPIVWEDGYVIPSTEPGLGVELNEAVALANPWPDDLGGPLHLSMVPDPVR